MSFFKQAGVLKKLYKCLPLTIMRTTFKTKHFTGNCGICVTGRWFPQAHKNKLLSKKMMFGSF